MSKIIYYSERNNTLDQLSTREVTLNNGRKLNRLSTKQLARKLDVIMKAENARYHEAQKAHDQIFGPSERLMPSTGYSPYRAERYEDAYTANVMGR